MAGAEVRGLRERDIDAVIHLTDLESWGYTRADFLRLLALSREGCFVAEEGGRVVGVLTTTSYGPLAFLGAVIVAPEKRGLGVGKILMSAALDHLAGSGVRTVRLNAYLNVVPFYEALGFRREYEVIRWHGPAHGERAPGVRPAGREDLQRLASMDEAAFGVRRDALLGRLLTEFPGTFLVAHDADRLDGFIVGNPGGTGCEVGPWVVDPAHPDAAPRLIRALGRAAGARELALSGPSENARLLDFTASAGYAEAFRTLRMHWGEDTFPGDPARLWALAGLEKG